MCQLIYSISALKANHAYLDTFDAVSSVLTKPAHDMLGGYSKGTQPMQYGILEPPLAAEGWINVQRVVITVQSVQSS